MTAERMTKGSGLSFRPPFLPLPFFEFFFLLVGACCSIEAESMSVLKGLCCALNAPNEFSSEFGDAADDG